MDPVSALGLMASLADIISLTNQLAGSIANVCGIYIDQGSDSSREITLFQQEVTSLRLVLNTFSDLSQVLSITDPSSLGAVASEIIDWNSNLTALNEKIDPGGKQDVIRKIQWPLTRDELERATKDIERYKVFFNIALQVDPPQRWSAGYLEKLLVANGADFNSFWDRHEDDYTTDAQTELLQQIIEWAESPQGKYIFWLRGPAGTGKSTISRMVAEHLQTTGMLGASFFFQRGWIDRGNATRVFTTIAKQLAANVPLLIPGVSRAVAINPDISNKSPKLQFDSLLLQPLLSLDQNRRTTTKVLVVDGLDECDTKHDIRTILHLLPQLRRSTCVPIRIFLTSRPEITICQEFQNLSDYRELDLLEKAAERLLHKTIDQRRNEIQLSENMARAAGANSQISTEGMRLLLDRKPEFKQDGPRSDVSDNASCPPSIVFSMRSILSTALTGTSRLTQTEMESAIDELVSIFFEDQKMNSLYQVAVNDGRIGPERFARNFRRLLKLFSANLKEEAQDSFDMQLANLILSKAGFVANTIRDKIKVISDGPRALTPTDMSEKPIQDVERGRRPNHSSTEDMEDTDDTDGSTDGDEAAERAQERFAVLISQGRSFIVESNAFKKLQKDLEKFVSPDLGEVPLITPEIEDEHHPAPSYSITTSALGISPKFARRSQRGRKYYLNLQRFLSRIGFQESSIPQHHRRLRWTNRRGEKLYDDYIEHEPGALRVLQDYLDTSVEGTKTTSEGGQGQTSARPTSSHMSIPTSTWVNNTGSTNRADESLQLPDGVRNSLHENDVELGESSSRTLRLMSCIERRGHPVKLHQELVSHIKEDRELFHALRRIYHDHKGRFESYWSLRTIQAIHFMKFTYGGHPYIDVRCHNEICEKGQPCHCIPPPMLVPPMGAEYECCPVPPKLSPPVGPQLMMSLFNDPDSIKSGAALIMQQLPKRMSGKLCSQSFEQAEAWGIYYEEGWNWAKIWLFLNVGFFLPSLVFGILWGILRKDVQGAFGIASWWMTGATIILGVIGTCS